MSDNTGSDPSDDESDIFSEDDSDASGSDEEFDPPEVFLYMGEGNIPRTVRRVEVDRSVKIIPDNLFEECGRLESVLLHQGLLRIGNYAFYGCSSLRSFQCPLTVMEIGWRAFCGCSNLATVELPAGLRDIEDWTFGHCTSLEEVRIPASVARISTSAFAECTNLALVDLHEGLRIIGAAAFGGCRSLGNLRVPSSVAEIGEHAFVGCSSLALIELHEHLPRMKCYAFWGCLPESFRFIRLSERREAINMDEQTASMFDSRLNDITYALTRGHEDWEASGSVQEKCKKRLERAHEFLNYLELKGAIPVLELALWKAKIEGQGEARAQWDCVNNEGGGQDLRNAGRDRKRPKVTKNIGQDTRLSRKDCRVKCGASMVIPEVLKFFTYSSSWPRLHDSDERNVD